MEKYVKEAWASIQKVMTKDLQGKVGELTTAGQAPAFDKKEKRKILYDTLFLLHKAEVLTISNASSTMVQAAQRMMDLKAKPAINPTGDKEKIFSEDNAWEAFLKCITVYDKEKSHPYLALGKNLLKSALDVENLPISACSDSWKENHSINPAMKGKILMSSSDQYTCSITDKTLENKENPQAGTPLFDHLKNV